MSDRNQEKWIMIWHDTHGGVVGYLEDLSMFVPAGAKRANLSGVRLPGRQLLEQLFPGSSVTERLEAAKQEKTWSLLVKRYYHDKWKEQKKYGGVYYAVLSEPEFRYVWLTEFERYLHKREAAEHKSEEYVKPDPLPFDALPEPLQAKIQQRRNGCWEWQGPINPSGYGRLRDETDTGPAHRKVFELLCNSIPKGLVLRHQCHNRKCVNPDHLIPGTAKENSDDRTAAGRYPSAEEHIRRAKRKLSHDDVRAIRRAVEAGESQSKVGERFGIRWEVAGMIFRREVRPRTLD